MKINFIIPFTSLTGGIKIVFEYCNRLKERGHDVVIYVPMKAYRFNNKGVLGNLKIIKSSIGNTFKRGTNVEWFDLNVDIKLVPLIKNCFIRDADVVVATAWPTAYDVNCLQDSKGRKIYLIQHYEKWSGDEIDVDNSYKLPLNQIVIAKWLKDLMKDKFNRESNLIYNGIDSNDFNNKKSNKNKNIVVSMLYHRLEWKGYEDGLKAFEIAKQTHPNIKLKLFGIEKGENIPEYAEFYLNPSREEIKKIYSDSDIFIFPSRSEGWGLTVIEAMACKCAVVGTNTGAISEIGIDRENCLVSEPGNVEELAMNLVRIINDTELRTYISNNGYNTATKFDWKISVDKMEKYFKNLIKGENNE